MESLSFEGMVELYEETRGFNKQCLGAALDFLEGKFPPNVFKKVFEPGIGTGRIAIPLAVRGYEVAGVDISKAMLGHLRQRLAEADGPLHISFQKADVTKLPFRDAVFDMAIAVHLFYFIPDWRKAADEILRVVKRSGPLVLMHTGQGAEIPSLRERYKELSAEEGFSIKEPGVKSTGEVVDYFRSLGYHLEGVRDRWQWTARIRVDKALGYMKARAYSFTAATPDDVHLRVMERLEAEIPRRFKSQASIVEVPNQIYLVQVLRK